jgi:hypothetical protein
MRLVFPVGAATMYRNIFLICTGATAIFAGSLSVYTRLVDELEKEEQRPPAFSDAKTWLQVVWLALLASVSGAVYSFFALCH